jgi:diacylglycerol kinase (ATP)
MDLRKLTPAERLKSFRCAFHGVTHVFRSQPNAWIMALATAVVVAAGCFFHVARIEWALLATAIFLVFVAETINTAIESLTDLASPERHPLAGQAKDAAAGAVLLTVLFALFTAILVFGPRVLACLPC